MKTGLKEMAEGVNGMRRAVTAHNPANLDVGMEAFLTGGDKIAAVTDAAMQMAQRMAK